MAFFVAVACGDVHDGGESAAVFGTEAAAVDVGVEDDIGFKDGVEADGVEGVVDNHAVEEAEVLDHGAAADVELSALVAGGVDAGEYLEVLSEVGGAADGGHLLDLRGGDFLDGNLCLYLAFLYTVVGDIDGTEGLALGFEGYVADESLAFFYGDGFGVFLIADEADAQGVGAFGHFVDEVEAIDVGGGAVACALEDDVGKGDDFARLAVGKGAFDGLRGQGEECCGEEEEGD